MERSEVCRVATDVSLSCVRVLGLEAPNAMTYDRSPRPPSEIKMILHGASGAAVLLSSVSGRR